MRGRLRQFAWLAVALAGLAMLYGCAGMQISEFEGKEPRLELERYFEGRSRATGLFEDRFGRLRRQFVVDIEGTWDGELLTLDERFRYADGERDRRVWRITKIDDSTYEGRADDIIGVAKGKVAGNALNWRYSMDLPVGDSTWRVDFDDWMFLQEDGVLLNRARMSKWGITLGTVMLSFYPLSDDASEELPQAAE